MSDKIGSSKLILAIGATIGVIAVLLILFGCGARHYAAHPVQPQPTCSHGAWSVNEHCSCADPYDYNSATKQCERQPLPKE